MTSSLTLKDMDKNGISMVYNITQSYMSYSWFSAVFCRLRNFREGWCEEQTSRATDSKVFHLVVWRLCDALFSILKMSFCSQDIQGILKEDHCSLVSPESCDAGVFTWACVFQLLGFFCCLERDCIVRPS